MGQDVGPLLLEKEIPLPGVEGRIDHFSVDVPGQRLFIAALENGSVEILDTRQGSAPWRSKDSKNRRVFTTIRKLVGSTLPQEETASFASMTTSLTVRETLEFGGDADNVRYDQQTGGHLGRLRERRNRNCELDRSKRRISRPW